MKARTLKFNFAMNVAGAVIPLAVSLVTVPIYIRHIGDARYGVLSIVWILLGYFGFLDLGLSRAAANALARLRHASQPERARVLVTVLAINFGLGCFGALVLYTVGGYLLQHVLAVPDGLKTEIADAFPWVAALLPLAMVAGVGNGALESRERFALINALTVAGVCLGQIIPVVVGLEVSPSLTAVIPAAVLVRCVSSAALLAIVFRSEGPLTVHQFDRREVPALLRYGGWVSVTGAISPILAFLDQFMIGTILGVAKVPTYSVPMNLVLRSQVFPAALSRTLFPRLSSLPHDEAGRLASRAFITVAFGYAAICAPAVMAAPLFFRLWISPSFATVAAPVANVLFLGAWANAMAFVPFSLLQSQGRPDITGKFHSLELVPFVAVLWLLTRQFGVEGAAVAWTLRCVVDGLMLFAAARMPAADLARSLLPCGAIVFTMAVASMLEPSFAKTVVATALVACTIGALAVTMAPDLRRPLIGLLSAARSVRPFRRSQARPQVSVGGAK